MPKVSGPVVGISFTDEGIHVVAARSVPSGGAIQVVKATSASLLPGIIENGEVRQVSVLAAAIKGLLSRSQIVARNVVIGLPSRVVTTRSITIPPVPDKERTAVIRGEIEHINALPAGQGAFDYVRLAVPPGATGAASRGEPILFYAATHLVVEGYRTAAQEAGLRVVGMEPADFAAMRVAGPSLAAQPLALAVSLGTHHTNLLFLNNGVPVYGRRLDIGIQQMIVPELNATPTGQAGGWQMFDIEDMELAGSDLLTGTHATPGEQAAEAISTEIFGDRIGKAGVARESLALELGRSLDYFRREYRTSIDDLYIVLLPNNLDLAGLPVYMATALEQDVHFVYAFEHVQAGQDLPPHFLEEEGVAYAPALGLALGALGSPQFASVPHFDLSVEDVAVVRARQAPRLLVGAAAVSGVLLLASGLAAFLITLRHAPVERNLQVVKSKLQVVEEREKRLLSESQQNEQLVYNIRSLNVPWTSVLRELGQAVIPGVAITNISTQQSTQLSLSGQATDPSRVPNFWNRLNASAFFPSVTLPSQTVAPGGRTTFQMNASLPPPPPPPVAPQRLEDLIASAAAPSAPTASGSR